MLAALVQCLVHLLDTQLDRGYRLPSRPAWVIADNKWRATRYGLDANIVTNEAGPPRRSGMRYMSLSVTWSR